MIAKTFIVSIGFLFSKFPYKILEVIVQILSRIYFFIPQKRKRLLLSNLTYAFPGWSSCKVRYTARRSIALLFEMGFFSLIYPHLSCQQRRATLIYTKTTQEEIRKLKKSGKPTLILLPHLSLFETLATSVMFRPNGDKTLGAIYRPNSNPSIDKWINKSREDLGLKVFSRSKGLVQARKHLKDGNWLVLLFDQNAGLGGKLSLFLNRICSVSPLPDILTKGMSANIILATPFRSSFFQAKLKLLNIDQDRSASISNIVHQEMENIIKEKSDGLPEWLWSHGKWKTQDIPHQIFHLHSKRCCISMSNEIPRKTKIWIRMPNWLGDIVMASPLIRAIEKGRPDAEITLLCQSQYESLLKHLNIGHKIIVLPQKGFFYFLKFLSFRKQYPDVHYLFTNSLRGDLEAYLCGAPLRLSGSTRKKRNLLSHQATISQEYEKKHQVEVWTQHLRYFGLKEKIILSPLISPSMQHNNDKVICLAPGSSNTPEKRWPIENWINLLTSLNDKLPGYKYKLTGSKKDTEICNTITKEFPGKNIANLSGETNLTDLCNLMRRSNLLICNDSGAMHLANSIGVSVVALFGVTSHNLTGPVFETNKRIVNLRGKSNPKDVGIVTRAVLKVL